MSGPKLSEAELERRRQEQLERERKAAIEREKRRRELKRQLAEKTGMAGEKLEQFIRTQVEEWVKALDGQAATTEAALRALAEKYIQQARQMSQGLPHTLKELEKALGEVDARAEALRQAFLAEAQPEVQRTKAAAKAIQAAKLGLGLDLTRFDGDVAPLEVDFDLAARDDALEEAAARVEYRCKEGLKRKDTPDPRRRLYTKTLAALGQWADPARRAAAAGTVRDELKVFCALEKELLEEERRYADAYDRYAALCTLLKKPIRPQNDLGTAREWEEQVEILEEEYRCIDEMEYIADTINEVMEEQGYSLMGSSVLRRRDTGSQVDYSLYQFGDDTGIAVYTGENGEVMMEIENLGQGNLTDDERDLSYEEQLYFCASHPELVEALEKRGILINQKSWQAPDACHARRARADAQADAQTTTDAGTQTAGKTAAKAAKKPAVSRRRKRGTVRQKTLP
ncbi:MAG: hypothetical protein IIV90_04310 [Oscillospiraceae bacterium]|nr:hypothetical protein [Oscillospiraceae bacterium]